MSITCKNSRFTKKIIDKTLPWMQTKLSWPGGVLSISLGICLLSAAFTEAINIHAILGAFIAGIAFGDTLLPDRLVLVWAV